MRNIPHQHLHEQEILAYLQGCMTEINQTVVERLIQLCSGCKAAYEAVANPGE